MSNEIKLEVKLVASIKGTFNVPSYQRGYRWGKEEITRLLNDIYTNGTENYCLQPIVVRKEKDCYKLIDGQQRLTTLYLIYEYMHIGSNKYIEKSKISFVYETRKKTEEFLNSLNLDMKNESIDCWFLCSAYEIIKEWFESFEELSTAINPIIEYFKKNVKVIWYEIDATEDDNSLFTRLNIGKIPLTSAELVKAMFLSKDRSSQLTQANKEEISLQWDNIEKELHNESFWYFLSNSSKEKYQTRIDLLLDLISGKDASKKDRYYTFYHFDSLKNNSQNNLNDIWQEIQHSFLVLKDWFENHELYHKVGYLIATEEVTLQDLFDLSKGQTKDQFIIKLNDRIRKSVDFKKSCSELSYDRSNDHKDINKLLLLFNVESVRTKGENTQWFPFDKYKFHDKNEVVWSLEHIHAQQSEGMTTEEEWREWLERHLSSVKSLGNHNDIVLELEDLLDRKKIVGNDFRLMQEKVFQCLSAHGSLGSMHSIANLALLSTNDNAALSNSTFDVKRNEIIQMDKNGQYIPHCTKMVFLKYYTPSEDNQLHFWGQADRIAYIEEMNLVLKDYLSEKIQIERDEI